MTATRGFKSDAFAAIHGAVAGTARSGTIDNATRRDFDATCLAVTSGMAPAVIKQLRENDKVSQPVFARHLNISESTTEKWETGAKTPGGEKGSEWITTLIKSIPARERSDNRKQSTLTPFLQLFVFAHPIALGLQSPS